ncbi:HPP family protein [Bradyrhizobium sp. LHD-71]|uniref:HPP family protein n=1 Tax=Bradyrhizobium sp. LHD-71 TaxID=3072141 RepID=UPI00280E1250|nr:HPP family protein [Bradyrhizobium sp. LHD-71]MDQ8726776.1 HPP family protein [Bradyrhizobium sp. LHD-71]
MLDTQQTKHDPGAGFASKKALGVAAVPAILCAAGCTLAIYVMESSSALAAYPMAAIPFATSIVLVISQPHAIPAQPRALIGGHLISALVGLVMLAVAGSGSVAAAVAVGLAVLAMLMTDTLHPPAGINPLLVVTGNLSWSFIIAPVLVGALMLAVFALAWHRLVLRNAWPERWL